MRALIIMLVGLGFLIPAGLLLLQPPGPWSLLWDTLGLTSGLLGTLLVVVALAMAIWHLVRGA